MLFATEHSKNCGNNARDRHCLSKRKYVWTCCCGCLFCGMLKKQPNKCSRKMSTFVTMSELHVESYAASSRKRHHIIQQTACPFMSRSHTNTSPKSTFFMFSQPRQATRPHKYINTSIYIYICEYVKKLLRPFSLGH